MSDKFNHFNKAKEEVAKPTPPISTDTGGIVPKPKKETKEQMSIMLTPTHKKEIRILADNANMSVSELIGYWINESKD